MLRYELAPLPEQQKSFYGKAHIEKQDSAEFLISYETCVMKRDDNGVFYRMWESVEPDEYGTYEPDEDAKLSATTLKHIKAFSGMNKREYLALENVGEYDVTEWL